MAKKTAFDDLLKRLALRCEHGSTKRAKHYLLKLYEMMLDELKVNGQFKIPKFGVFKITHVEEKQIISWDGNKKKYIYVPERYDISFIPSKYLKRSINEGEFKPITKMDSSENEPKYRRQETLTNVTADLLQCALERQQKKGLE